MMYLYMLTTRKSRAAIFPIVTHKNKLPMGYRGVTKTYFVKEKTVVKKINNRNKISNIRGNIKKKSYLSSLIKKILSSFQFIYMYNNKTIYYFYLQQNYRYMLNK